MVNTRSQTKMAENADLLFLLSEMKKSMAKGQEEIKKGQEGMRKVQEEMRKGQEEMKNQIQSHVESEVGEIKDHFNSCIERIEEDVQSLKREIGEVNSEVERKIEEVEDKTNGQISDIRRTTVFKTQFDVVSSANEWNNRVKVSQFVASLRGSAVEVLQGIPSDKLTDLTTIENALEARFGDSHLTQFYRTELKTRRQKPGESLQVLAADVERLMTLAYAKCPQDVRDSLAGQYFVDAIREEDTQYATRLMDAKDLKSALTYSMKYKAAKTVSKTSRNVRSIEIEDGTGKEKDEKFDCLLKTLEKLLNNHIAGKKNTP
ncbi:hypothetical protein AVEN_151030-1 [Araneus ventricosus]|uniref:Uncharacterized protein n=1 Tax=Araneus ventricosus TaxID=182803 RepID=A0A4Y2IA55_ARAVE|nr:hypothetical protein AVEN_151030-1 [Araneus ventricosus]